MRRDPPTYKGVALNNLLGDGRVAQGCHSRPPVQPADPLANYVCTHHVDTIYGMVHVAAGVTDIGTIWIGDETIGWTTFWNATDRDPAPHERPPSLDIALERWAERYAPVDEETWQTHAASLQNLLTTLENTDANLYATLPSREYSKNA